ncbi:hypothetical protein M0638_12600 [Roseomonas sp. NAR14]|uniref:Terminase small subunit n=1 Tax=Roseomonas acroporae TaxID=2937791 RepID=A0A9X1YA72_9PROT|nr:hypothetical protein [Roseomonas acroporae]MCK8785225.1 hypothetical protein [Roseomonas acroporae]
MSEALAACSDETQAQRALTEKEQRLVDAIVHAASRGASVTREQAGTAAGYGRGDVARIQASRALARPAVRAALTKALQEAAQIDAASSLAVLRHLERRATSERVRLDAALAGLRIGGLDQSAQQATGAGVTVQIVFRTDAGETLAQRMSDAANIVDSTATDESDTRLEQARVTGPRRSGRGKAPPGGVAHAAAEEGRGVENPRAPVPSRVTRKSPAPKGQGGKNPGPRKPRKKVVPDGS